MAFALIKSGNSFDQSIHWEVGDQIWARNCDFEYNDILNTTSSRKECGTLCEQHPECTHFSWNDQDGGTCWLKDGVVSKFDAIKKFNTNCGLANTKPSRTNIELNYKN